MDVDVPVPPTDARKAVRGMGRAALPALVARRGVVAEEAMALARVARALDGAYPCLGVGPAPEASRGPVPEPDPTL